MRTDLPVTASMTSTCGSEIGLSGAAAAGMLLGSRRGTESLPAEHMQVHACNTRNCCGGVSCMGSTGRRAIPNVLGKLTMGGLGSHLLLLLLFVEPVRASRRHTDGRIAPGGQRALCLQTSHGVLALSNSCSIHTNGKKH